MQEATRQQAPAELSLRRSYRGIAPDKVWRAWTDPQALSQWFGPGAGASVSVAEIDLRVGGRYRIVFHTPDGDTHEVSGLYQEVLPHRRLVFSWAFRSTPERVSRVSIELTALPDGTELHFVHDRFFDQQARINHERGWTVFFDSLAGFLQGDAR